MPLFTVRLLFLGALVVIGAFWAISWWVGVLAVALYAIMATIILRPIIRRVRAAREQAKCEDGGGDLQRRFLP